ncbi:MAG: hypothetical protein KDA65_10450 [Planctomycetaceae bacterium]|nr:hypothetical protein [Planctomycetaceae bacterium]
MKQVRAVLGRSVSKKTIVISSLVAATIPALIFFLMPIAPPGVKPPENPYAFYYNSEYRRWGGPRGQIRRIKDGKRASHSVICANNLGDMGINALVVLDELKELQDHPNDEVRIAIREAIKKIEADKLRVDQEIAARNSQ